MTSVGRQTTEEPLVRVLAYGVLDALQLSEEELPLTYMSIIDRHLEGKVRLIDVCFLNGPPQQLVFNEKTSVEDAIAQVAWTIGERNPADYALCIDSDEACIPLNQDRLLSDVLLDQFYHSYGSHQMLLFDKKWSRVTEEEKTKTGRSTTSFVHWQEQYLHTDHFIQKSIAALLCILQIQANHDTPDPKQIDNKQLSTFVDELMSEYIPKVVTV